MAVGQQPNQQTVDHVGLTDNGAAHLGAQGIHKLTLLRNQRIQRLDVGGLILSLCCGNIRDKTGAFSGVQFVHDTRRYLPHGQAENACLKIV